MSQLYFWFPCRKSKSEKLIYRVLQGKDGSPQGSWEEYKRGINIEELNKNIIDEGGQKPLKTYVYKCYSHTKQFNGTKPMDIAWRNRGFRSFFVFLKSQRSSYSLAYNQKKWHYIKFYPIYLKSDYFLNAKVIRNISGYLSHSQKYP